jgi:hypothetical protein
MKLTEFERVCLMEVILQNIKEGGEGVLISETEYEWMLNELINDNERYEDCVIFRDNKEKIVGDEKTWTFN